MPGILCRRNSVASSRAACAGDISRRNTAHRTASPAIARSTALTSSACILDRPCFANAAAAPAVVRSRRPARLRLLDAAVLLPLPCVAGCAAAAADAAATATAAAAVGAVAGAIGCGPSPAPPVFFFFVLFCRCRCCFSRAASVSAGSACRSFVKQASQSNTAARRPSVSRSRSTAPLAVHPACSSTPPSDGLLRNPAAATLARSLLCTCKRDLAESMPVVMPPRACGCPPRRNRSSSGRGS